MADVAEMKTISRLLMTVKDSVPEKNEISEKLHSLVN